jgi:tripartite-type tricarboxylate transporter receptor subunit TctC
MSRITGVPMVHVPYRGGSPMTQDLVGGQIDLFLGAMGSNSTGLVANGKLKMLAIVSPERLDTFQNVPSVRESRSLKDLTSSLWVGLFVRKGTPAAVVQALHKAMTSAMADPALSRAAAGVQIVLARPQTLAQAEQAYAESIERFRAIARSIQLKAE